MQLLPLDLSSPNSGTVVSYNIMNSPQEKVSHFNVEEIIPIGYRFMPTDEELLNYLNLKLLGQSPLFDFIKEVDLYNYHPFDLCRSSRMHGKNEWFFFTSRNKKSPNGGRPSRVAGNGYWKSTGGDDIPDGYGRVIGHKMVLVYYEGKTKNSSGTKTNWIMHEYTTNLRIEDVASSSTSNPTPRNNKLDKCVSRVYYRTSESSKNYENEHHETASYENLLPSSSPVDPSYMRSDYVPDHQENTLVQSINDQYYYYQPVDQSNNQLASYEVEMQRDMNEYTPFIHPNGTEIHGNYMAMEDVDHGYEPSTDMNHGDGIHCSVLPAASAGVATSTSDGDDEIFGDLPPLDLSSTWFDPLPPILGFPTLDYCPPLVESSYVINEINL